MAHFYGGVSGNRGPATRTGTKNSGLQVFANGWNAGVEVSGLAAGDNDRDAFVVRATTGSSNLGKTKEIAEVNQRPDGSTWVVFLHPNGVMDQYPLDLYE